MPEKADYNSLEKTTLFRKEISKQYKRYLVFSSESFSFFNLPFYLEIPFSFKVAEKITRKVRIISTTYGSGIRKNRFVPRSSTNLRCNM